MDFLEKKEKVAPKERSKETNHGICDKCGSEKVLGMTFDEGYIVKPICPKCNTNIKGEKKNNTSFISIVKKALNIIPIICEALTNVIEMIEEDNDE